MDRYPNSPLTPVKNDWYVANVWNNDYVRRFEIIDMSDELVCSGIAKFDGCMDFNDDGIHLCDGRQILAFAEILCVVRLIAISSQQ